MESNRKDILTRELIEQRIRANEAAGFTSLLDTVRCAALLFIVIGFIGVLLYSIPGGKRLSAVELGLGVLFLLFCRFRFQRSEDPYKSWQGLRAAFTVYIGLNTLLSLAGPFFAGMPNKLACWLSAAVGIGFWVLLQLRFKGEKAVHRALADRCYFLAAYSVNDKKAVSGGKDIIPLYILYLSDGSRKGVCVSEQEYFLLEPEDTCFAVLAEGCPVMGAFPEKTYDLADELKPLLSEDKRNPVLRPADPDEPYNPFFIRRAPEKE